MNADELEIERVALTAEHAALEAEFEKLRGNRRDVAAHIDFAGKLKRHLERLHRYMEESGLRPPKHEK